MNRTTLLLLAVLTATSLNTSQASASRPETVAIRGRIEGLQPGDTLRFMRVVLPEWKLEPGFERVATRPGRFAWRVALPEDQYYMLTYHPRGGKATSSDRSGLRMILCPGDRIRLTGRADEIYYARIEGGLYDEPRLAEVNRVEDSVGRIRGSYLRLAEEALERGDTVSAREWGQRFNLFYEDNPGVEHLRGLQKEYREANPDGNLYLAIALLQSLSNGPLDEAHAAFDRYPTALKESRYGRMIATEMELLERLQPGHPAPDFRLIATDGRSIALGDLRGRYVLLYHWGLCPGSIYIDARVQRLYEEYRDRGFLVIGLTESIATVRSAYASLPAEEKVALPGTEDIRPVLASMLQHAWPEVELETDHPENAAIKSTFNIAGWPYFVLIGPDGTLLARDFTPAFFRSKGVLEEQFGTPSAEK